jgi:thiol-disulfide isomerase/thioredoxin
VNGTLVACEIVADDWDLQVLESSIPVAVEFWAPWCPWFRRLTLGFEALSVEYENRLSMVKLNGDVHPKLAMKYDDVNCLRSNSSARDVSSANWLVMLPRTG